jgi:hypothetical protein
MTQLWSWQAISHPLHGIHVNFPKKKPGDIIFAGKNSRLLTESLVATSEVNTF